MTDETPTEPTPEPEPPKIELRFVAWTVEETAHVLNPERRVAITMCGKTPKTGGSGRLKKVLFLDSPGNRPRCGTCDKRVLAKMDAKIATEPTPRHIISR